MQGLIHISLEGAGGITQTEGHHQVFELSEASVECRLPLMAFCHTDLIKGCNDVQLSETLTASQPIQCLSNRGNRVSILDRDSIKFSVVHTESQAAITFANNKNWGSGSRA